MSDFEKLTEDYSRAAVPDSETSSGLEISVVMIGALITLPVLLAGATLGNNLGLTNSIITFVISGIFLACLGAASGMVAAKSRLTTWLILQYSFGRFGAKIVSLCVGITILGWYGATVDMFARAVQVLVSGGTEEADIYYHVLYLISASILMVGIALFGFKGLDKLSKLAVPVMVVLLIFIVFKAVTAFDIPVDLVAEMTIAKGISATIGAFIVAVTMFPDICRYSKSSKDAVIASSVSFGVGVPLVLLFAAIPMIYTGEQDFLKLMLVIGLGTLGLILLLLATWTTNAFNLYSASLIFASIFESIKKWKLVIFAGIAGTVIALLPILENFLHFLHILAVLIPPIIGIYLADFFIIHKQDFGSRSEESIKAIHPEAFIAWILSASVGYLSNEGMISFTTIPAVDAVIIGFVSFILLSRLFNKA